MADKIKTSLVQLGTALKELRARVSDLNARIEALQNERSMIEYAPLPRSELVERFTALIDSRAEHGARSAEKHIGSVQAVDFRPHQVGPRLFSYFRGPEEHLDENSLAFWFRDLLVDRARKLVETMPHPESGLPSNERPAAMNELDRQIETLEAKKAALLDEARTAGIIVTEHDVFRTGFESAANDQ